MNKAFEMNIKPSIPSWFSLWSASRLLANSVKPFTRGFSTLCSFKSVERDPGWTYFHIVKFTLGVCNVIGHSWMDICVRPLFLSGFFVIHLKGSCTHNALCNISSDWLTNIRFFYKHCGKANLPSSSGLGSSIGLFLSFPSSSKGSLTGTLWP